MNDPLKERKNVFNSISKQKFDIIVIGGGIIGAGIARDASLRGYKVLLIEKDDFGSGTSSGSSKLIHAGLRYLATKEFGLVRAASIERKKIVNMTPNISKPLKFIIPAYKDNFPKNKARLAVWLYDIMAGFRNFGFHKIYSKKKALKLFPNTIRIENFQGAATYYDASMDDARITLENILSAESNGATVLNYCKAEKIELLENGAKIKLNDYILNETIEVIGKVAISATGIWTDQILNNIVDYKHKGQTIRSTKGIHLITEKFFHSDSAVVIPTNDDRIIFVLPFGKYNCIGTTDTDYVGNLDYVQVTDEDVMYLIDATKNLFGDILTKDMIVSAYSGLRPLIESFDKNNKNENNKKTASKVSRKHEIFKINNHFWAIAGGKYTTFREMSKEIVDKIEKETFLTKNKCLTDKQPLWGWSYLNRSKWEIWSKKKIIELINIGISEESAQHLLRYGIKVDTLIEMIKKDKSNTLKNPIIEGREEILVEVDYSILYEKVWNLSDFMLYRTQLQLSKNQGKDCVDIIVERMAQLLNWDRNTQEVEKLNYKKKLVWNK